MIATVKEVVGPLTTTKAEPQQVKKTRIFIPLCQLGDGKRQATGN